MNNKKINFITQMGFTYKNGTTNILKRDYKYTTIEIDIQTKKINYIDIKDNQLKGFNIGRDTSANLSSEENYSVLECINELLEQGYHPNNITIEKPFSSGSAGKDIYLDILVSFPNDYHIEEKRNNTYMMIEVKKKSEYSKTIKDSLSDGGKAAIQAITIDDSLYDRYRNKEDFIQKYILLYKNHYQP